MPQGGITNTGQFPEFLEERRTATEIAIDARMKEVKYKQFTFDRGAAKLITERLQDMEPMPALSKWYEGRIRERLPLNVGWAQLITQQMIGGEVVITYQMQQHNQWDLMNKALTQLKDSSVLTQEFILTNYLVYGNFSTASGQLSASGDGIPVIMQMCPDGNQLFSQQHSWRSGGSVISNRSGTLDDVSETGFFNAAKVIRRWKGPNGAPLSVKPDSIIIPIELIRSADIVFGSEYDPNTANNAINTSKKIIPGGYEVNEFLPSTGEWYIRTTEKEQVVLLKWGWPLRTTKRLPEIDPANNAAICVDFELGHAAPIMPLGLFKVTNLGTN